MKRRLPYILVGLMLIFISGIVGYWWSVGRHIETTDNAYIRADITPVGSKVSGYVHKVLVADNQVVTAGQILAVIDDREYAVRLERGRGALTERQAALAVARGEREQQRAKIDLALAELAAAEVGLKKETDDHHRFEQLFVLETVGEREYQAALARMQTCQAELSGARAALKVEEGALTILIAEEERIAAEIAQQEEELKLLEQERADTSIRASITGTVGNRRVGIGQYVRPGSILMAIIPLNDIWVEANFKEIQLETLRRGQQVAIEVDAFPDRIFSGRIESLAPASGAEFSILPPENATGNFTKIVQRIPVRIDFDAGQDTERLLPGMSVEVRIDTRNQIPPTTEQVAKHSAKP